MTISFWTVTAVCSVALVVAAAFGSPAVGAPVVFLVTLAAIAVIQRRRDGDYFDEALRRVASFGREQL
jgi:hypothetical protein